MVAMRALVIGLVLVSLTMPAHAGLFGLFGRGGDSTGKKKLPVAIDSNGVIRPKLQEVHKAMKRGGNHPEHLR